MKKELIISYLPLLTKEHIINFANSKNINLSNNEVDAIYNTIHTYGVDIVNSDYSQLWNLKYKLTEENYNHLLKLIDEYKHYL